MNNLKIFNFESKEIRTVAINNEPWWVAKDICEVFGEANHRRAIQSLDEDEKGVSQIDTPGGVQSMTVVNESGLYSLLFSMQPNKARGVTDEYIERRNAMLKTFKRWITHEVLPSIRKHGMYATEQTIEKLLNDPDTMIKTLEALKSERELRKEKELIIEQQKPKVLFADAVAASHTSILIGDLAKLIKQNGYDIGQKRLFEWLRQNEYLIKSGASKNMPTQKAMDLSLFEVKERPFINPDGSVRITFTTKVTGKGQLYFVNKFSKAS